MPCPGGGISHQSTPSSGSFSSCWCSPRLGSDDTYAPFMEEHPLVTLVDLSLLYATNVLQSCPDLYPYHTACPSCPFHSQSHCIRTWCLYSQYFGTTIDLLSSRTNGLREGLLCFASVFEMACHSAISSSFDISSFCLLTHQVFSSVLPSMAWPLIISLKYVCFLRFRLSLY